MNSVKHRLASALALLQAENRLETASVSEICRLANVNRSNVYASHRQMLLDAKGAQTAKSLSSAKRDKSKSGKGNEVIAELECQVMALRYICFELTLELEAERKKSTELANEVRKRESSRRR